MFLYFWCIPLRHVWLLLPVLHPSKVWHSCGCLPPTEHGPSDPDAEVHVFFGHLHNSCWNQVWLSDVLILSSSNWLFCPLCQADQHFGCAGSHSPHSEEEWCVQCHRLCISPGSVISHFPKRHVEVEKSVQSCWVALVITQAYVSLGWLLQAYSHTKGSQRWQF